MSDPFWLPPQSVLSFSGGRTSGVMLRRCLDAHGGSFPEDRRAIFCNTGKERPETLDFVERCSLEWSVPITWLEYRWEPGRHYFAEVNYATASRDGEPFSMAIKARNFLPNPVMRFCTGELKVKTCSRYVRQVLGWDKYHNAIGYRSDEPKRVHRLKRRAETVKTPTLWDDWVITDRVRGGDVPPGETPAFPLFDAGIDLAGVRAFWAAAPFDLGLEQDEGNCDLCFLKGGKKIVAILQDRPDLANWWIAAEEMGIGDTERSGLFRKDRPSYRELVTIASGSPDAERWGWMEDGTSCGDTDCRCTD